MLTGSVQCRFNADQAWADFNAAGRKHAGLHLWHARASALNSFEHAWYALLSKEEQAAATRFYRPADRLRYTIQHALLKLLLRWYLDDPAYEPVFGYDPNKKPFLLNQPGCHFNLSNTGDEFLIAIADTPIGIDIESIKPRFAYRDIAAHYFSADEIAFIDAAGYPAQAFFLLWTRKEALLKATGRGLDDDLPLIPALDGLHRLPPHFEAIDWMTESFCLTESMISVTSPAPGLQINNWLLTPGTVAGFNAV